VAAAGVLVAVVSLPYLRVQASDPAPVPVMAAWTPEILQLRQRAWLASYVTSGDAPYVGGLSLALAAIGVVLGLRPRRPGAAAGARPLIAAVLATALCLVLLSLGPYAEFSGHRPFAWLWSAVPGLRVFRIPLRFGFFVSLPVAVLGGLAAAACARAAERGAGRLGAWLAAAALVAGACWQVAPGPIPLRAFPADSPTPAAYEWLARQPCADDRCAILEVPAGPAWDADPGAVFWTLAHGHPAVNGFSGFGPATYPLVVSLAAELPESQARDVLTRLTGARWLLVHRDRLTAAERRLWDDAAFPEAARFAADVVYELQRPDVDWRRYYAAPPADVTFAGTPLAPLPAGSRAELRLEDGLVVTRLGTLHVDTVVTNAGPATWPALTSRVPNRVTLSLAWIGPLGRMATLPVTTVVLPVDLAAGQQLRVGARLPAPATPGTYTLEARVVQEGQGPLSGEAQAAVRVAP